VEAEQEHEARTVVERLASDFLANPLVEDWHIQPVEAAA
jgi:phosphoribosylformylglycinamidine (FGAM) synthase PurS component